MYLFIIFGGRAQEDLQELHCYIHNPYPWGMPMYCRYKVGHTFLISIVNTTVAWIKCVHGLALLMNFQVVSEPHCVVIHPYSPAHFPPLFVV